MRQVEKWSVFEPQPEVGTDGNPYVDAAIVAEFTGEHETKTVSAFASSQSITNTIPRNRQFIRFFGGRSRDRTKRD